MPANELRIVAPSLLLPLLTLPALLLRNFCCTVIENEVGARREWCTPPLCHLQAVAQLLLVSIYKWLLS